MSVLFPITGGILSSKKGGMEYAVGTLVLCRRIAVRILQNGEHRRKGICIRS